MIDDPESLTSVMLSRPCQEDALKNYGAIKCSLCDQRRLLCCQRMVSTFYRRNVMRRIYGLQRVVAFGGTT